MSDREFRTALDDSKDHTAEEIEAAGKYLLDSDVDIIIPDEREDNRVNVRADSLRAYSQARDYRLEIGSEDKPLRLKPEKDLRIRESGDHSISWLEEVGDYLYHVCLYSSEPSYIDPSSL